MGTLNSLHGVIFSVASHCWKLLFHDLSILTLEQKILVLSAYELLVIFILVRIF